MRTTAISKVTDCLRDTPHHASVTGRDGMPCRVWKNPVSHDLSDALRSSLGHDGLRGLTNADDLYLWQSVNLPHSDLEQRLGLQGVRVTLRQSAVQANWETISAPEDFPWVFPDGAYALDNDQRQARAEAWLHAQPHLSALYPEGFSVIWYM